MIVTHTRLWEKSVPDRFSAASTGLPHWYWRLMFLGNLVEPFNQVSRVTRRHTTAWLRDTAVTHALLGVIDGKALARCNFTLCVLLPVRQTG